MTSGNESINYCPEITDGLTKREYFAAMALNGAVSDPTRSGDVEYFAYMAVRYADALIAELNKPKP